MEKWESRNRINESAEHRYNRALFENMSAFSDAVWDFDLDMGLVHIMHDRFNPRMQGVILNQKEMEQLLIQVDHEEDLKEVLSMVDPKVLRSLTQTVENRVRVLVDGVYRDTLVVITPQISEDGLVHGVYATCKQLQSGEDEMARAADYVNAIHERDIFERNFNAQISETQRRLNIYREITEILSKARDLDSGVHRVLAYLGEAIGASRVYIFEDEDGISVSNTFEWCAPGIMSVKEQLQKLSYAEHNYKKVLGNGSAFCCPDVSKYAGAIKDVLADHNIKAMLEYPILDAGEFCGFIGVDDCINCRMDWHEEAVEFKMLNYVANLLSMYLIKERNFQKIEQSRREREQDLSERLSTVLGGIHGGLKISFTDDEFPYAYVSESVAAIQGYSVDELLQATDGKVYNNIYELDRDAVVEDANAQLALNGMYYVKYRVRHKDGSLRWVIDSGKTVILSDGARVQYSLVQDVTEQEMKSQMILTERSAFRDAMTQNAVFVIVADLTLDLIIEDVVSTDGFSILAEFEYTIPAPFTEFGERFTQQNKIDFISKHAGRIFRRDKLMAMYMRGETAESYDIYLPDMDVYLRVQPILSQDPTSSHIMCYCIYTDVSEERKAQMDQEAILKIALEKAEYANIAKTIFLNNMSHDIRTPMNAIMGFANLAYAHLGDDDKVEEYLDKIRNASDHLLSLINDVLDMSRIESGKVKIENKPVSLSEILEDLKNMVLEDVALHNLRFEFDITGIRDDLVWCDKLRLNQVLLNCVSNSIKFTPENGMVGINVSQLVCNTPGFGLYQFQITDPGVGMSEEFQKHIFEPFERESTSTISGIQGTGLGMTICKNIVDMLGGAIEVESRKGEGTTFLITVAFLLVTEEDLVACNASDEVSHENASVSMENLSVLLVEDNEYNREIAVEILEDEGFRVSVAMDGKEAVDKVCCAQPGEYDVILMDIQMPVMDGYEATRRIRNLKDLALANMPIIAMTANAFEEDKRLAKEAGMNAHLAKPIRVDLLLKTIQEVLS